MELYFKGFPDVWTIFVLNCFVLFLCEVLKDCVFGLSVRTVSYRCFRILAFSFALQYPVLFFLVSGSCTLFSGKWAGFGER